MKRLEGRVAWISGATSGIGAATARMFAREGARVGICARTAAEVDAAVAGSAQGSSSLWVAQAQSIRIMRSPPAPGYRGPP